MNKNLLLVTLRKEISNMYKKELNDIFDNYLNIYTYSFEEKNKNHLNNEYFENIDLVVVTSSEVYSSIRNIIDVNIPIIYLGFTFNQDKIDALKKYPRNTRAYIGFKSFAASFQAVNLLYNLGLNNLNIKVYNPKQTNISDIDLAIFSDDSCLFPNSVENLVSLGQRKLSFTTIMDIATTLNIMDDELENKIFNYTHTIAKHSDCVEYFYDRLFSVDIQLHTIINCIDDSFLMVNQDFIILDYNNQLLDLFNIKKAIKNFKIFDVNNFSALFDIFLSNNEIKEKLISINYLNKDVIVSKKIIKDRPEKSDIYIFIIKDVTDILNLEGSLRNQMVKKGYIAKYEFSNIKGESFAIKNCVEMAKKISKINKSTLIIGESGTGKELFAQSIHNYSDRKKYPFVAINCAALPTNLLESELFGYDEGSFTGAKKGGKPGLFEKAHRGTLFLDEIGEISVDIQAKLLRVIEEKEVMRVGGNEIISVDVRIIAATNKDLKYYIDKNLFRLDLFFRLNTITLNIPSLRERKDDIPMLIKDVLSYENQDYKKISDEALSFMMEYSWKGNIRELKNCVEYMAAISDDVIEYNHLPEYMLEAAGKEHRVIETPGNEKLLKIFPNFHEYKAAEEILKVLTLKNIGRRGLLKILHDKNILISEYMLRSILSELKEKNYVSFGKGRSGVFITNEAKKIM